MNEHTTADYLNQLAQDREDLVDNLEAKGITGLSGDETFTELVPEVLNISGGADLNDYFPSDIQAGKRNVSQCPYIAKAIKKIPDGITVTGTDLSYAFCNCESLKTIPFFNTSNVITMTGMFANCISLEEIPLLDTSSAENMGSMFSGCKSLTTIPQLNTSNATYMAYMFNECNSLVSVPVLNVSKITSMQNMFSNCKALVTFPAFDTSNITNMSGMCQGCTALETLPVLDTSNVTTMGNAFSGCRKFTTESLTNLLTMCINVNASYTAQKTLRNLFGQSYLYKASAIEALPNYQAFLDAGWTIGWS